jgi:hypothetical protein
MAAEGFKRTGEKMVARGAENGSLLRRLGDVER